ncbi:MAG: 50S ribosomal protein L19 [Candidatus Manganitrophus sp.]|nr:MAG: 50S ribosomal protein L19 [Candidatus Manganitrophus sp.]
MNRLERLERGLLKQSVPDIKIGATVRVHVKIIEGEKERIQVYEGVVIRKKGTRNRETFTVRKVSYGVGVERVFPIHSPYITQIDVVREGKVNRAKLYYLRERTGQAARISERGKAFTSEPKTASPLKSRSP